MLHRRTQLDINNGIRRALAKLQIVLQENQISMKRSIAVGLGLRTRLLGWPGCRRNCNQEEFRPIRIDGSKAGDGGIARTSAD